MSSPERIAASFRDPSGHVFKYGGVVYRQINQRYRKHYQNLIGSGLYDVLVESNLMVSHIEIEDDIKTDSPAYKIIKPDLVSYISYPYEWCFSQLKDAALLTLQIQKLSLQHGMTLKDASAFNIQFVRGNPVFIDTLSFEVFEDRPWSAYKQFCQHFLAPLALMSNVDHRLGKLARDFIDGIPLDLASSLLPFSTRLNLGLLMNIHLHARNQRKFSNLGGSEQASEKIANLKFSVGQATALIDQLTSTINKMHWNHGDSEWGRYYEQTNYSDESFELKLKIVTEFCEQLPEDCRIFQDLGANDGYFARKISKFCDLIICHDIDEVAVERNYQQSKSSKDKNILPLIQDLTNPSPGLGWCGAERESFEQRSEVDVTIALALIHHLAISNNVPLENIVQFFARLSKYLIIEFVPKADSQVRRLLSTREDIFEDYREDGFELAFSKHFEIISMRKIDGTERTLYLLKRKL